MSFRVKYSNLGQPRRIFTVAAVHGEWRKLAAIHRSVFEKFTAGDRLVYTGNYFAGRQATQTAVHDTMQEILFFRRALLARPGVMVDDIVYLRGRQEELWRMILQIQMSFNAEETVAHIIEHYPEMDGLFRAYGTSLADLHRIAREGIMSLTKWSSHLRDNMRAQTGHEKFFTSLRRAAFTDNAQAAENNLLFVHAGLDPTLPLPAQEDGFWWHSDGFNDMTEPYAPFRAVIRGHDPDGRGIHIGAPAISLDGGCGYGGQLVCAALSETGDVTELISI